MPCALGGELRVPGRMVNVVDTVGAGDTFTSGLLARLGERGVTTSAHLRRMPREVLEDTLRFATAAAALTLTRAGAEPPRRAEVEAHDRHI